MCFTYTAEGSFLYCYPVWEVIFKVWFLNWLSEAHYWFLPANNVEIVGGNYMYVHE